MRLFKRSRVSAPLQHNSSDDLESLTQSIGADLLGLARAKARGLFSSRFWSDKLMAWAMQDAGFKTQLFRFVDVMPVLRTPEAIHRHLVEYLTQPGVTPPPMLRAGLAAGGLLKGTLARTVTGQVESMANRFVAGTDAASALPALRQLWHEGVAFSVDLLGEACVSDVEASEYQRRYLDLIGVLPKEVAAFEENPRLQTDHLGPIPKTNVSIKVSSLSARINPADFEGTLGNLVTALRPILEAASKANVFVNFDMEQYGLKDLAIELFKRCCEAIDFPAGLAMQAYLRSGERDAANVIEWAKRTGRQVTVRLIKGAYWDYETTHAAQMNWPVPVWEHKGETDACFERMTDQFVEQVPRATGEGGVKLALGSHNLRSIAHALAAIKKRDLPDNAIEFQMLRGMADELKGALVERGYRVREYLPVGQLVPGMAYLVRRLLENTSNESWLRAGFSDGADAGRLLAAPHLPPLPRYSGGEGRGEGEPTAEHKSPLTLTLSPGVPGERGFRNEPLRDFSQATQRDAFAKAITASTVPRIANDSTIADAENAIASAHAAFPAWRDAAVQDRADILRKAAALMRDRRDDLAGTIIRESAKPWGEADADVCEAIDFCEYYARHAIPLATPAALSHIPGEDNQVSHEPRGVAAVISPWNFPLAICCGMTVAALVTGNTAIVKPAEQTPGVAKRLCDILWQAGVPHDVLHVLPGQGEMVGAALVRHPRVATIAFTGSKAVGLDILRAAGNTPDSQGFIKRVICEMGGKNAIIVDASADIDEAVLGVRQSAFSYAGQKCSACSRAIVLEDNYDVFLSRLVESTRALAVGDPLLPGTDVGPLIDAEAAEKVRRFIEIGKQEAKLEFPCTPHGRDGRVTAERDTGVPPVLATSDSASLISPHIFSIEHYDAAHPPRIATEEIFGPVLTVIRVKDLDEALAIANASTYKLTGGCFTRTPSTLVRVRREFRVGNLYLNRGITGALVGRQPFGGFGLSGAGTKAGGAEYLRHFTDPRVCTENTMRRGFVPDE
jgi:RHH-type proline utilization regulon transcriptional repressor/proline dehydrogenase/delta 1-pyrroline-5-carboxylate dehydrogenase